MDKLSERLSALAEKATKGPWHHYNEVFRAQISSRRVTEIQQKRTGRVIVHWMGFDGDGARKANSSSRVHRYFARKHNPKV